MNENSAMEIIDTSDKRSTGVCVAGPGPACTSLNMSHSAGAVTIDNISTKGKKSRSMRSIIWLNTCNQILVLI